MSAHRPESDEFWRAVLVAMAVLWAAAVPCDAEDAGVRDLDPVVAVELRIDARTVDPAILRPLIEIEVGKRLDPVGVRRTLLNLHAVEGVGRAEVRTRRDDGGFRVTVAAFLDLVVGSIEVDGDLCIRKSALTSLLQQVEGAPLNESRLVRGVYRMEETLFDRGYRDGRVQLDVEVDEAQSRADVRYRVECGVPTAAAGVTFQGDLGPFGAEELQERLKVTKGERLDRRLLDGDRERLRSWLIESGYGLSRVAGPDESSPSDTKELMLNYTVDVGPRVDISIVGAERKLLERKADLDLLSRERFDEALVRSVVENVRRYFQRRGHYDVEVDWEITDGEDEKRLEMVIREGPVYALGRISFRGNETIRSEDLAARMTTSASGALGLPGRLVDEDLEDDLDNLEAYYARQGFDDASIGPVAVRRSGSTLELEIPIAEGPRQRLVSLNFEGIDSPEVVERLATLPLSPGGSFHPLLLEETLQEVRSLYEDAGYLWAQVEGSLSAGSESELKDVIIRVLEGPQVRVGRVIVRGNARTRSSVVLRSAGIEPGQVVNRSSLLEAQRRLFRLGVFSLVEVRLAPGTPLARSRDVLVRVREGQNRRVTFGLGYDSEDGLRALLGYSHVNIGRRAISARLDFRLSQREELARALLRQPFLGRWNIPVTYSLFAIEEDKESFGSRRRGAQVEGHRLRDGRRLGLLLTYKFVDVLETSDVPLFELGIDRNLQDAEIASATPSLQVDRRDDPLLPTRGWMSNLQGELAMPVLGAEAEYRKLFGQYARYFPVGRLGVVAASVRLGAIDSKSGRARDSSLQVPISEQFFAGGRTTHRAYKRDLLGVLGETILLCNPESGECGDRIPDDGDPDDFIRVPVGGNAMFLLNLDYRFPIAGPIGGTVFLDAGNVWSEWTDVEASEVKLGAGIGFRYLSPIGPLRLEVGWKLEVEEHEAPAVVFLSFGNPF